MKSTVQRSPAILLNPLKAIKPTPASSSITQSPYLRSVLAAGKTKATDTVRVFSIALRYEARKAVASRASRINPMESSAKEWFLNYE